MEADPDATSITAVVVSWNTRELLGRCLESLRPEAEEGLLDAVVVDNGSADGSAELVAESHPWARLIEPGANLGFGGGANLGAAGAETPWLLIVNADIEWRPGALRRLLGAGEGDSGAGIAAPRLISPDGRQEPIFAFPGVWRSLLDMAGMRRFPSRAVRDWIEYGTDWDPEATQRIDWAMGAALLVRREPFEAVGCFDEAQWMYAEDLDLAWRLDRAGWGTLYVGDAVAEHAAGSASGQAFTVDVGRRVVSQAYYDWLWRRRGRAVFWAILAINITGTWLRRIAFGLLARLGSERAAGMHRRFALKAGNEWSSAMAARRDGNPQPG